MVRFTGVSSTMTNTDPCCCKVCHRPANCYMDFHSMGNDLLLGPTSDKLDMSRRNHSKGICCIKGRLSDDEKKQQVAEFVIATSKRGICLRKSILVKLHTLMQLT